jgi:hypothetical protein
VRRFRPAVFALTVATLGTASVNLALAPHQRPVQFELAPNAQALQGVEVIRRQTYADFIFIAAYTDSGRYSAPPFILPLP